jgi:hypothetical protein
MHEQSISCVAAWTDWIAQQTVTAIAEGITREDLVRTFASQIVRG